MANILLDYFFKIAAISPTPQASTAFLKQVCIVVKPKSGQEGNVGQFFECTTMAQVAARTDNTEAQQLFNAGMTKVIVLLSTTLNLEDYIAGHEFDFFTLLISSDFTDADVIPSYASGNITITSYANLVSGTADTVTIAGQVFTAQAGAATPGAATFQAASSNNATATSLAAQINAHTATKDLVEAVANAAVVTITAKVIGPDGNALTLNYTNNDANVGATKSGTNLAGGDGIYAGAFPGVIGISSTDDSFLDDQAVITNRAAFHTTSGNKAKNMFFAFGKLLSNSLNWLNQQYITMPFANDVDTRGEADSLFDDKISFVISDTQYSNRLGLFAAGGKAIIAPYVIRNLEIDMQSAGLSYVSGNQPAYTKTQAALLEDELQKVIDSYVTRGWIQSGKIEVKLEQENFVASAYINVAEPNALWRIFGEMRTSAANN